MVSQDTYWGAAPGSQVQGVRRPAHAIPLLPHRCRRFHTCGCQPLLWADVLLFKAENCQVSSPWRGAPQRCFCISDPHNLKICCRVNGEVVQSSNTSQMVFKTEELMAWVSQ